MSRAVLRCCFCCSARAVPQLSWQRRCSVARTRANTDALNSTLSIFIHNIDEESMIVNHRNVGFFVLDLNDALAVSCVVCFVNSVGAAWYCSVFNTPPSYFSYANLFLCKKRLCSFYSLVFVKVCMTYFVTFWHYQSDVV